MWSTGHQIIIAVDVVINYCDFLSLASCDGNWLMGYARATFINLTVSVPHKTTTDHILQATCHVPRN